MKTSAAKSGFAPVNDLNMYYEIHGNGKPIVLIHGGGSTINSNWETLIPKLTPSRQVIAVEMQAHGRTDDIDRDFTFEQDADDIAALLHYLNIAKADILGFSNGGQTTIQIAIRHPNVVNKIVIASAGYKREGYPSWFWSMMKDASFESMPQPLKDAFLKVNPDPSKLLKSFHRDATRMNAFQGWSDEAIRSIKAPTLIVGGAKDVVTPEHLVEIQENIAGSWLTMLPGGHGDYLGEKSSGNTDSRLHQAFADMLLTFLDHL